MKAKIILYLLALVVLSNTVLALDNDDTISPHCAQNLFTNPGEFFPCTFDQILSQPANVLNTNYVLLTETFLWLLTLPVNIFIIHKFWLVALYITEAILVLLMVMLGYQFMNATSTNKRAEARTQVKKYLIISLAAPMSFILSLVVFDFINWLTSYMWHNVIDQTFLYGSDSLFASAADSLIFFFSLLLLVIFGFKFLIRVIQRLIFLLLVTFLTPLALVLWYIPSTKELGSKMIKMSVFNLLMPLLFSLVFMIVGFLAFSMRQAGLEVGAPLFFIVALWICITLFDRLVFDFDLTGKMVSVASSAVAKYRNVKALARVLKWVVRLVAAL